MAENEASQKSEETREELAAKLEELSVRAKAAGLSPLRMMAEAYAKRGLNVLDHLLSALEEDSTKRPATETTDAPTKKV